MALCEEGPEGHVCPALKFLRDAPDNLRGSARGFRVLFERYAEQGRQGVTAEQFHEANKEHGIWEFIKGRLRVFCFQDDDRLVVLTHGALKKSDKAKVSEAISAKRRYLEAKAEGLLKVIGEAPDDWKRI